MHSSVGKRGFPSLSRTNGFYFPYQLFLEKDYNFFLLTGLLERIYYVRKMSVMRRLDTLDSNFYTCRGH